MSKYKRLDVRIPIALYEKIQKIAEETNQPPAPRTGQPSLAPVVVSLLEMGLTYFEDENNLHEFTPNELRLRQELFAAIDKKFEEIKGNG